ncbi:MAG: hypothetical protein IKY04_04840 [Lachnospiraceae bacterium]|nr:hypothetical protein [Lachnospiraceae bacterium]MBR5945008.1 hypothetical protein [Lachnospiraceae bacterium]
MGVYVDNESKANDNRSSGITFLLVGTCGIILTTLVVGGFFPISLNPNSKYLIFGVMYAMFALFIVLGVVSVINSARFEKEAKSEMNLFAEMEDYCKSSNIGDLINAEIMESDPDLSDEEMYFKRCEVIKDKLNLKFMNLDEAFLDNFIDKIYSDLFGES